eukprot:1177476-Prorocentrum_minimum.AAC.1
MFSKAYTIVVGSHPVHHNLPRGRVANDIHQVVRIWDVHLQMHPLQGSDPLRTPPPHPFRTPFRKRVITNIHLSAYGVVFSPRGVRVGTSMISGTRAAQRGSEGSEGGQRGYLDDLRDASRSNGVRGGSEGVPQ